MDIVVEPQQILRKQLAAVDEVTPEITELVLAMKQKMIEAKGVGLAANQIGRDLQLFVIEAKLAAEHGVPEAYINPEITEFSDEQSSMEEGCLSLPGLWQQVSRSKKIKLKALDEHGNKIKIKARGFLARVYQHEWDHLQGVLIKDKG